MMKVVSPPVVRCRDLPSVRSSLTTLRILKSGGVLDCSGATFVDPGFIALLHHMLNALKPASVVTISLPGNKACCDYMLKHLQLAKKKGSAAQDLRLRLPTDFPLRRVGAEDRVVPEIGAWRAMLQDSGVPEQDARSFGSIMSEVLTNSFQHGGKLPQQPIIAGQTFRKGSHSTLVAVDQGQSIPLSLQKSGRFLKYGKMPDNRWIELALDQGVTALTRPTNRGIGLYHLRKKVQENKGSLCIVSGNGAVAISSAGIKSQLLGHQHFPAFPGTMLILDIKRN